MCLEHGSEWQKEPWKYTRDKTPWSRLGSVTEVWVRRFAQLANDDMERYVNESNLFENDNAEYEKAGEEEKAMKKKKKKKKDKYDGSGQESSSTKKRNTADSP